jgi:hypothetical protein
MGRRLTGSMLHGEDSCLLGCTGPSLSSYLPLWSTEAAEVGRRMYAVVGGISTEVLRMVSML